MIILTEYEQNMAKFVGMARYNESRKYSLNRSVRGYDASEGVRIQNDIEGAGAEIAVAKSFNVYWHGSVNVFKDYPDVGRNTQVRQTKHKTGRLIITDRDPDDQLFVLVIGEMPTYDIIGFIKGADAKREEFIDAPAGRPPAYFVPQDKLTKPKRV
jgi:hypothetical protein